MSSNPVLGDIAKGAALKHTVTDDKSAPVISGDVHIKKNEHGSLLGEVQKGANLQHVSDVNDRSNPVIEKDVTVKPSSHPILLNEIKAKGATN